MILLLPHGIPRFVNFFVTDYSARNVNYPMLSIIFCQILSVQPKYTHTNIYTNTHRLSYNKKTNLPFSKSRCCTVAFLFNQSRARQGKINVNNIIYKNSPPALLLTNIFKKQCSACQCFGLV